jgi:hypothetical protein
VLELCGIELSRPAWRSSHRVETGERVIELLRLEKSKRGIESESMSLFYCQRAIEGFGVTVGLMNQVMIEANSLNW